MVCVMLGISNRYTALETDFQFPLILRPTAQICAVAILIEQSNKQCDLFLILS